MENVMTNGFCELNEQEMMMVDGGWEIKINFKIVEFSFGSDDVKAIVNWYKNEYYPWAYDLGGKIYDWIH